MSGIASIALITLLTVSILGIDSFVTYINVVLPCVAKFRGWWYNLSLPGYWTKLFDPASEYSFIQPITRNPFLALLLSSWTCLLSLGTLAWAIARARTRTELDLSFGLTMTAMLLVSPVTWSHYLLIQVLPLAMAWTQLPPFRGFRLLLMAIVIAFWAPPYVVFDHIIAGRIAYPFDTVTIGSYQCYALVALFFLQIVELRRSTQRQQPTLGSQ